MCARIARIGLLYRGCYAHVISRSIRKMIIFKDYNDFEIFKDFVFIEKRKSKFKLYHYCLMHTHFHLAVELEDINDFSQSLSNIKRKYAGYFHEKYKLSGPIWRERFKSLLIENEAYLFACGKYIEENPVKAGMVEAVEDWAYSSGKYYCKGSLDDLVDVYKDNNKISVLNIENNVEGEDFEKGSLIGSRFFRFQFFDSRRKGMS